MKKVRSVKLTLVLLALVVLMMPYLNDSTHKLFSRRRKSVSDDEIKPSNNKQESWEPPGNADSGSANKIILLWTTFFKTPYYNFSSFASLNCPISDCIITRDRNLLNQSDALVFHATDARLEDLPSHRSANQRYIFAYFEAANAVNRHQIFRTPPNYFNWTMTYRRESDLVRSSGEIVRKDRSTHSSYIDLIRGKTKLVAWFVSHCNTISKRELYYKELAKYIPVDVYGSCGNFTCPKGNKDCNHLLRTQYKFYLAFENSLCKDYVTEKFFRALEYDVVPVVYGGADYKNLFPPHSFINVKDFRSPKELAQYLLLLNRNEGLYETYFHWKKDYAANQVKTRAWCDLCAKLHDSSLPEKSYESLADWFFGPPRCTSPGKGFPLH